VKPAFSPIERRALLLGALALLAGCAAAPPLPSSAPSAPSAPEAVRLALAPTGKLRIAVYPGSPTSMVAEAPDAERRGLTVDVGRELARRLGVPPDIKVYPRVAEVVAALSRGEADVTITNATPERQKLLDFAPPLLALELGVLVPAGSPVSSVDTLDQPGARLGVSQGSSSERVLGARIRSARLVPQPTLQAAAQALRQRELEAFATNKAILFELADNVPGARVLPGRWGLEHLAIGTGKGRELALPWLTEFNRAVAAEGLVARAAERAGLRGTAPVEAR
jgi:polar amino acid transport system substrate-binding protein